MLSERNIYKNEKKCQKENQNLRKTNPKYKKSKFAKVPREILKECLNNKEIENSENSFQIPQKDDIKIEKMICRIFSQANEKFIEIENSKEIKKNNVLQNLKQDSFFETLQKPIPEPLPLNSHFEKTFIYQTLPSFLYFDRHSVNKNLLKKNFKMDNFVVIKKLGKGRFSKVFLAKEKETNFFVALKEIEKNMLIESESEDLLLREIKNQSFLKNSNIIQLYGVFEENDRIYLIMEYAPDGELYKLMKSQGIVKLADFGWSICSEISRKTFCGTLEYVAPEILEIEKSGYNKSVDVWSIGILIYELTTGKNYCNH